MGRQLTTVMVSLAYVLTACATGTARAGNPTYNAQDTEFWNGTAFVLVAKVLQVERSNADSSISYRAQMEPRACIAGLFNPASSDTLVVDMLLGHERWTVPKPGDLVLAVIFDRTKLGVSRPGYGLAGGQCSFMPDGQPLVVLKGADDPAISNALHKIRAANPTTAPTNAPTTAPSGPGQHVEGASWGRQEPDSHLIFQSRRFAISPCFVVTRLRMIWLVQRFMR